MGVGRGGKKVPVTSGLKGGRRAPEHANAQGSKAQKASAPPREEALDEDDDPMQDVKPPN